MSKNFDMIATVNIDIDNPIMDESSYGNILIVGPLPANEPAKAPAKYGEYFSLEEVTAAGWVAIGEGRDPVGVAALVAFSQKRKPASIFIAPVQEDETALDAVKSVIDKPNWYVLCPAGVSDSEYENIAKYIETTEKGFCYTEMNFFGEDKNTASLGTNYTRTWCIYGCVNENIPEENKYLHIAWMVSVLRYAPGSETFAFKEISLCTPSDLSTTDMKALENGNVSYFVEIGGKKVSMGGKVLAGEWIDVIRFRDWLKNNMQTKIVNLFLTTSKVPYTDPGIGLVQNQMLAALKEGADAGGIAPDEFDGDGKLIPGYSTSVPLAASIDASEKKSRKLKNCKFKARLAGAIHVAEVDGSLSYNL